MPYDGNYPVLKRGKLRHGQPNTLIEAEPCSAAELQVLRGLHSVLVSVRVHKEL